MKKSSIIMFPLLALLVTGCKYKYQSDNIVEETLEEAAEVAIESYTGAHVNIDLTPSTPETGFSPTSISPVVKVDVNPKK